MPSNRLLFQAIWMLSGRNVDEFAMHKILRVFWNDGQRIAHNICTPYWSSILIQNENCTSQYQNLLSGNTTAMPWTWKQKQGEAISERYPQQHRRDTTPIPQEERKETKRSIRVPNRWVPTARFGYEISGTLQSRGKGIQDRPWKSELLRSTYSPVRRSWLLLWWSWA